MMSIESIRRYFKTPLLSAKLQFIYVSVKFILWFSRKHQEGAHSNPEPIHALVCMATLRFLLEIKSKFCCWAL